MTLFFHNKKGERRMLPPVYRLLLAAHVVASGVWLGTAFAKLVLGLAAAMSNDPVVSRSLYLSTEAMNVAFPPTAVATLATGVLLSLGTKWGLLEYYWVATKLAVTIVVVSTGIALADRLILRSISTPSVADGAILGVVSAPTTLLISLFATHVLLLIVATVLSVYKPWGKTFLIQRKQTAPRSLGGSGSRYR